MYHLIERGIGLRQLTALPRELLAAANSLHIIAPKEAFVNPFCEHSLKFFSPCIFISVMIELAKANFWRFFHVFA